MGLFKKEQSYLGVDIGKGSIKIVELKNDKGRARLVTYGYIDQIPEEVESKDFINSPEYTGKIIKQICNKAKMESKKVIAALPIFSVFSSILNLTNVSKKELENPKLISGRVEWEAKKIIPLPIEEMILDWKLLDEEKKAEEAPTVAVKPEEKKIEEKSISSEKKGGEVRILLTAAPKKLVQKYLDIFKAAGLELISLETEAFALIRSLVGVDKSPLMILDSGAGRTSISIINKGIPYLNRSIDVGGATITKALSVRLGFGIPKAEQFKIDLQSAGAYDEILKVISTTVSPVVNEIRYSLNMYKSHEGGTASDIDKIIVTGGSALLVNFADYLSKSLNMRVFVGDPWARVIYPEELKPLLDELGPRFAVAIGLAMCDIE